MKEENIKSEYQRKVDKSLIPTCNIMGVNIAAINMNWLLKYIDENLSDIKGDYICVSNVHTTVTSYEDAAYCAVQNGGLMAIPDGGPLSSVGRKRGYSDMDRTTGPSLMGEIFKISAEKGYRHYFYGSTEETLKLLEEKLQANYPGIQIAGMYSPPFRPLTEEEDTVLFSGTSCQIAALKAVLQKDYSNLILVDIICHGVPSPKVWKDYLEWAEQKYKSKCIGVDFRNKKKFGWAAHKETLQLKDYRGKVKCFHSEVFKNMFYSHYTIRPSCYKCPYKDIMHPADITIADFWKIDSAIPGFNDDKGVSLVLINNEKGEKVFDLIKKDLIYQTSTVEKCMMSTMQRPFSKPEDAQYRKRDVDI